MSLSFIRSIVMPGLLCLSALLVAAPAAAQNTMVRLHTTQGPIDFKLLDAEAPITVANFLAYVQAGDYSEVLFHRSVRNFVIQGGGFRWPAAAATCCVSVTSRGKITNEFSANRSNLRGTVAMAKIGSDANSATNQWFVNLSNNAANLDNQNGGFTVFARVTAPGMVVADKIAALSIVNAGSPFDAMPLANYVSGSVIQRSNAVLITQATVMPALASQTESDRIFNHLEATYPQYLSPSNGGAGTFDGYSYRYYAGSNAYVGTKDGKVWYLVPAINGNINELGSMVDLLAAAQAAGY